MNDIHKQLDHSDSNNNENIECISHRIIKTPSFPILDFSSFGQMGRLPSNIMLYIALTRQYFSIGDAYQNAHTHTQS